MFMARGNVHDRPFGKTVGMLARRGVTGELQVESDGTSYAIAFAQGHVVAARSPAVADCAATIAIAYDLITFDQADFVAQWVAAAPGVDEVDVVAKVGKLSPEVAHRLRRRTIARCAGRIVSLERGEFTLSSRISLAVVPGCEMHVGGVIYQAAQTYVFGLDTIVDKLGTRFELRRDAVHELAYFGFGDREKPIVHALAAGISLADIRAIADGTTRRLTQAVVYALASCGALYCDDVQPTRLARGTRNPISETVAMATEPIAKSTGADAFERGQRALKSDRLDDAVVELELATQLAPNEPTYLAALAWARFCKAPDKARIAAETRKILSRAIARSDSPVLAHYYLGLVERILDRTEQALEHFREVLELEPKHKEAATEIRFLTRNPKPG